MVDQVTDPPEEEEVEEIVAPAAETPEADKEVETAARDMGWVPESEWKGDPEHWRPADEFVQRGKELAPIIASQLRKERAERSREQTEFKKTISNLEKMSKQALTNQRSQLESKFEADKERAVELGDTKAYKAASEGQKKALQKFDEDAGEKAEASKGGGNASLTPEDESTAKSWWQANPQLEQAVAQSPLISGAVNQAWMEVQSEMFGSSVAEKLQEVKNRVVDQFGDRIGLKPKSNGSRAPAVEGAGGRGGGSVDRAGKLFAKLPKEAQAQADSFIKDEGLFLEKGEKPDTHLQAARERYAKDYFEDNPS